MIHRIEYIDAMRGLAILLVVFVHIEGFCFFDFSHISFLGSMISLMHLPLFFFISGFLAFKQVIPTERQIIEKLYKLLVPMCIVGLIYTYFILNKDIIFFVNDTAKAGYWFTLVLCQMYLIYYFVEYVMLKYFSKVGNKWLIVLMLLALIMYLGKYPMRKIEVLNIIGNFSSLHYTMNYFQYFVLGMFIAKCNKDTSFNFFTRKRVYGVLVLLGLIFFISSYYKYYMVDKESMFVEGMDKILSMVIGTFCSYCGVFGIYLFFKNFPNLFFKSTKLGRMLNMIGSHTLDIYLLHYFFLYLFPLSDYSSYIQVNIVFELIGVGILTLLVVCASLLLSGLIRKNAFTARLLLGIKIKK